MKIFLILLLAFITVPVFAQSETDGTDAKDRPIHSKGEELDKMTAPYVELSRQAFPKAREQFLAGLPEKYSFFVVTRLHDPGSKEFEQVYVKVEKINEGKITGKLASDITTVHTYKNGDPITCLETEICDWTIVSPDGSEEGNFVGKFLDVLQDNRVPLIVKMEIATDGSVSSAHFERAINRYKQDVSYCIPEAAKQEAENAIKKQKYPPQEKASENFAYVIYLFREKKIEPPAPKK